METPTETTIQATTSVQVSREASNLLDEIVASIKPKPTKASVLDMLIEQEAERRGILAEPDAA